MCVGQDLSERAWGNTRLGPDPAMFRQASLPWEMMLQIGVKIVLKQHGIGEGVLATDDSDHERSKKTKGIFKTHKIKDKVKIQVKAVVADALYGQAKFMDAASVLFGGVQVIRAVGK